MRVKQQEAVIFPAIVAKKVTAIPAVPHCLTPLIFICMAIVTAVCSLSSSHREMSLAEFLCWLCQQWSTWMFACAVISNQALGQLYPECLEVFDGTNPLTTNKSTDNKVLV